MNRIAFLLLISFLGINIAQAQQFRTYTTNDDDSLACIQNYSLYSEFVKQENWKDALPGWRKAVAICPKFSEAHWVNGLKIVKWYIENQEDEAQKEKYIDTLLWTYDQRIVHYGKEGYVLGRKGVDMAKLRKDDPKAANDVLVRSLKLQGNDTDAGALIYAYKTAYDMYRKKLVEKDFVFNLYLELDAVIAYNLKEGDERKKKGYESARSNIDKWFGKIAECPDLVEVYTPKFEANPENVELLKQILKFFDKQGCTNEELYQKAAVALYPIEPSAEAAYAIANGYAKKENYSDAATYFVKATETEDDELKFKALEKAANTYLLIGQYKSAYSYAAKMLAMNPNSGEAYIAMGNAYVKGRNECGDNECTKRAAYWAAVDKYSQAKSVDASVSAKAQKLINSYTAQFPKKEDCFFHGMNDGDTYTFSCWIGGSTKVRTRAN